MNEQLKQKDREQEKAEMYRREWIEKRNVELSSSGSKARGEHISFGPAPPQTGELIMCTVLDCAMG